MHRIAVVLLTFAVPVFAASSKDATLHLAHEWHVSLDAGGKVTALHDSASLDSAVRQPLEQAIRGWSFDPGRVNGNLAATETTLTVDLSFVPTADDKYAMRIDDARTGGSVDSAASRKNPPRMPRDAIRTGLMARIVVKVDYDANGKIVSVETQPEQDISGSRSLRAATVAAVKKWLIEPERVGGHGVAASVMVPICYLIVPAGARPPDFACAWTPPGSHSKIDNGAAFALAPATKLKSDVIGHAL